MTYELKAPMIDALQYSNWNRRVFEDWRDSGVTAVHATAVYHEGARETLTRLAAWNQRFRDHADLIRPIQHGTDLEAARHEGRVGVMLGAQNPSPIENEIGLIEVLRNAGLSVMQVTYNNLSLLGAGCFENDDPGLSRMGYEAVREMNRVGMVVDLSHGGERTQLDTIAASQRPVAMTHANPRFFQDSPRGASDAVMQALTESGGMLGFSLYVKHLPGETACTRQQFVDMVARTAEVMGPDKLGIGSDLCQGWGGETIDWMRNGRWRPVSENERDSYHKMGWPAQPDWFQSAQDLNTLAEALRDIGFNAEDVAGIMGGNWHRYFTDALQPETHQTGTR